MRPEQPGWSNETCFRPAARVVSAAQGGGTVLLDHAGGAYFGLSGVGSRIWELVQERRSLGAIIHALHYEYEVSVETLRADTVELLRELSSRGLVVAE
jgi:hypothetical protein